MSTASLRVVGHECHTPLQHIEVLHLQNVPRSLKLLISFCRAHLHIQEAPGNIKKITSYTELRELLF
jgi:hypothetical protein